MQNSREQWSDDTGWMDASVGINIGEHIDLVLEASNLTEEELVYYYDGIKERPNATYQTGAVYYFGVRASY